MERVVQKQCGGEGSSSTKFVDNDTESRLPLILTPISVIFLPFFRLIPVRMCDWVIKILRNAFEDLLLIIIIVQQQLVIQQ